jgi:UDP-glucose 4-epimerase
MHSYRGVRAVVLGASGFVGRWVARSLNDHGADVTLVVRSKARALPVFRRMQIEGHVKEADLRDRTAVETLYRETRPAITFNLIAYGVKADQTDPGEARLTNTSLVEWIADAAAGARDDGWPGAVLVHTGSALEYGRIAGNLAETSDMQPMDLYGTSKLAGTRALAQAATRLAFPAVTARLFMVYGPGEPAPRLLPSLMRAAGSDEVLPLTAGTQRRDFTYVQDVAEGLLRLGTVSGLSGEAINLATGRICTVREFVEIAARVLEIEPDRLAFGKRPTPTWEMSHDAVNVGRLHALTGWTPAILPEEGIRRTCAFFASAQQEAAHE